MYVEENDRFHLPAGGSTPIIMIGAGTGVAPYRAFVEHRQEHGHAGDNWLVFGDRNFASDFLYQLEWLRYRKDGILTRLDVAFSRDRAEKVYVQHRLREQARDLYAWLERGARVFRLPGIYGPGRSALDSVRAGVARRIDKPGHAFSRIHVDDIVQILRASMARPAQVLHEFLCAWLAFHILGQDQAILAAERLKRERQTGLSGFVRSLQADL